jgi:hypothetical protein
VRRRDPHYLRQHEWEVALGILQDFHGVQRQTAEFWDLLTRAARSAAGARTKCKYADPVAAPAIADALSLIGVICRTVNGQDDARRRNMPLLVACCVQLTP